MQVPCIKALTIHEDQIYEFVDIPNPHQQKPRIDENLLPRETQLIGGADKRDEHTH